jgi:hypothetical protein
MKKEKKRETFPWNKIFVIAVGVIIALMMIFQTFGMSWLQTLKTVRANDTVTIGFTLMDAAGYPVLTTNQSLYQTAITRGYPTFLTQPLTVRAGYVGNPGYTGVVAYNYYIGRSDTTEKFGILGQELDEFDVAVLGMKTGDTKTIHFSFTVPPVAFKSYEFTTMGRNFTATSVGDMIIIGFSETPMVQGLEGLNSTPTNAVLRMATVVNKTADSVELEHDYPSAEITVEEFK